MLPAIVIALFVVVISTVAYYWPPSTGEMAVVFPPGTSEKAAFYAVVAAGGSFVSSTRLDNIVIAYAQDTEFSVRVRALGGLMILAARGLCGSNSLKEGSIT